MMQFLTEFLIAGLIGTILCKEWSFQKWNGFSTSSKQSPPLYIDSRAQIIKCCGVCGSIPQCTSVVRNNDHCICISEPFPPASLVDSNTSVYVKRPKSCSVPGYILVMNLCIKVSTDQKNWHEAKIDCENTGGNLIILDSLEKHQRFYDMFSQYFDYTADRYFVGASDIEVEGNWKWIKENSFSYMHDFSFNNQNGDEDCGVFRFSVNQIIDNNCGLFRPYICEIM